ncbi:MULTISPECIES: hypothetical protein [Burkholderia]|uniref:hypothetical protein n=1 Tax=Burkholderia TaxID=32008 RepID=UPI0011AE2A7A|nr:MULTISPECIES: hypothetical protein [Burkholderia]
MSQSALADAAATRRTAARSRHDATAPRPPQRVAPHVRGAARRRLPSAARRRRRAVSPRGRSQRRDRLNARRSATPVPAAFRRAEAATARHSQPPRAAANVIRRLLDDRQKPREPGF